MIQLVGIEVGADLLADLAGDWRLSSVWRARCGRSAWTRPLRATAMRNQYYSTAILQSMQPLARPGARLLAVTSLDLYVPVLTFVFGEAQLSGSCAVVSLHRLREEFYGLPAARRAHAGAAGKGSGPRVGPHFRA